MASIRIQKHVEYPSPYYHDRRDAGIHLTDFMNLRVNGPALVLGLPRGGVPVAEPVSEALKAPLDIVVVRKLPIPESPEMGFGAITLDGSRILNDRVVEHFSISEREIEEISEHVRLEVRRRAEAYGCLDLADAAKGLDVYLVDDGLATGYTMIAAAEMIRKLEPKSIILSVPVSPTTAIGAVRHYFDEIYCLIAQDRSPFAVASFYEDFHDLSDDEVREILGRRRRLSSSETDAIGEDPAAETGTH